MEEEDIRIEPWADRMKELGHLFFAVAIAKRSYGRSFEIKKAEGISSSKVLEEEL